MSHPAQGLLFEDERLMGFAEIDFHGRALWAKRGEDPATTYVALKPICEHLGIAVNNQVKKIRASAVYEGRCDDIIVPSASGLQRTFALSLDRLNLWLASISASKVRLECRPLLIRYQIECAEVLFAHFFTKAQGHSEAVIAQVAGSQDLYRQIEVIQTRLADEAAEGRRFRDMVGDTVRAVHEQLEWLGDQFRDFLRSQRRQPTQSTINAHILTTMRWYDGRCPACPPDRRRKIIEDGRIIPSGRAAEFDHFIDRGNADYAATWIVCWDCNRGGRDPLVRARQARAFEVYHSIGGATPPMEQQNLI